MLIHRLRRWSNINPAFAERPVEWRWIECLSYSKLCWTERHFLLPRNYRYLYTSPICIHHVHIYHVYTNTNKAKKISYLILVDVVFLEVSVYTREQPNQNN